MNQTEKKYIPALRFNWLTRFYDPLVRMATREFRFKRALLEQADLSNNQSVLDLACGTLSIGIKRRFPGAKVFGFDIDRKILQIARAKAAKFNAQIYFEQGLSSRLPYADRSFDRVFSTLSFHHLTPEQKIGTIREILRVLKPGAEFHLADYGQPVNRSQKILSNIIRLIDGDKTTLDNLNGRLGFLLEENGFAKVERTGHFTTILGTIRLFRAVKSIAN